MEFHNKRWSLVPCTCQQVEVSVRGEMGLKGDMCWLVGWLVGRSVGRSVGHLVGNQLNGVSLFYVGVVRLGMRTNFYASCLSQYGVSWVYRDSYFGGLGEKDRIL